MIHLSAKSSGREVKEFKKFHVVPLSRREFCCQAGNDIHGEASPNLASPSFLMTRLDEFLGQGNST